MESMTSGLFLFFLRSTLNHLGGMYCGERGKVDIRYGSVERMGQRAEHADLPD